MATLEQLQAAMANAQAAGDHEAVSALQGAIGQAQATAQPDPEALTQAFYRARAAGDDEASTSLFRGIRAQGATLRAPTQDELAAYSQNPDAANGLGSASQNFGAGMGKSVFDNARGVAQSATGLASLSTLPMSTYAKITGQEDVVGDTVGGAYDNLRAQQAEVSQRDAPLIHSKAGLAGNISGQVLQSIAVGHLLKQAGVTNGIVPETYGGTAGSGALQGLMQPIATGQSESDRLVNAGLGAGAGLLGNAVIAGGGQLLKRGAGWVAGKLLPNASPEVASLAKTAISDYGIPLKASQVADSRIAKTLDSVSSKVPFSGAGGIAQAQQTAFNKAVASTIGEDADAITPALYAQAKKRIGSVYDDITQRNQIDLSGVRDKLAAVLQEATETGSDDSVKAVTSLLGRIAKQAPDGVLPGTAYQSVQSQLGQIAKAGGEKGNYAGQIKGLLSSALDDSISPADQAAWRQANQQYGNLKTIRDLVTKDQVNGNISPAALLGRVTATGAKKEAVASGRGGDLAELASIGQQFLKDGIPNSGTTERLAAYGLLGAGGFTHLPAAAGAVGTARAFQGLNGSPQVLAKILQDPSIDNATKSALLQKFGMGAGLLGQASALPSQRQGLLGGR